MSNVTHLRQPKKIVRLQHEPPITVLHVDDDEDFLICSKRHLQNTGPFQVENALSVKEAMKKMAKHQFDIIISDYQMAEKNGLEFLRELRDNKNDVPFVLFTGDNRKDVVNEALALGAERYLNKNCNIETLYTELAYTIKKAVANKHTKAARIHQNEIKQTVNTPEDSENKFHAITNSAKDGIILIDNEGKTAYLNPAAEKLFGYTKKEAIGKNLHKLIVPKKLQKSYLEGFSNFKQTGKGEAVNKTLEFDVVNKSGKTVPIEISISALQLEGKWHALATVRDCSERKAAWGSLEETIDELVKINEKLGVVGRLTRHDARNKLSVILNNTYLAKKALGKHQNATAYLQSIDTAVEQMTRIFDFAKTYEMLGVEELTEMNVEKIFNEAATLLSGTKNVSIKNRCAGLTVLADSLLRQLFYNLIHNSLEHGERVSQICVSCVENAGKELEIIYEDNGVGIPQEEKEKIFDEGYGKGTGYGLYLIKKICEAYGWTIKETGTPNKGARFVLTIPKSYKHDKIAYSFTTV
jgi:PAS domain S-box-containing protein